MCQWSELKSRWEFQITSSAVLVQEFHMSKVMNNKSTSRISLVTERASEAVDLLLPESFGRRIWQTGGDKM